MFDLQAVFGFDEAFCSRASQWLSAGLTWVSSRPALAASSLYALSAVVTFRMLGGQFRAVCVIALAFAPE